MSIINDALKKLQNDINPSKDKTVSPPTPTQIPLTAAQQAGFQPISSPDTEQTPSSEITEQTPKTPIIKNKESSLVYILGILCLMIGLFAPIVNKQSVIGMLMKQLPKSIKITTARPAVQAPVTPQTQKEPPQSFIENIKAMASPQKPTTSAQKPVAYQPNGRIILNGIMARGKQNLALIDGQVYEQGEEIDGIKIVQINPNNIVILENGVERTIKVAGR